MGLSKVGNEIGLGVMLEVWVIDWGGYRAKVVLRLLLQLVSKAMLLLLQMVLVDRRWSLVNVGCLCWELFGNSCLHLERRSFRLELLLGPIVHLVGRWESKAILMLLDVSENLALLDGCQLTPVAELWYAALRKLEILKTIL